MKDTLEVGQTWALPDGGAYLVLGVAVDGWSPGEDRVRCLVLSADPDMEESEGGLVDNLGSWMLNRCARVA